MSGVPGRDAPAPVAFVVPLWPDDTVTLLRQRRRVLRGVSIEVPGGHVDAGETPEEGALRELREETGLRAREVRLLWRGIVSVRLPSPVCIFAATGLRAGRASPDPDERLEPFRVPRAEAFRLLRAGRVRHAPSALALLLALGVVPAPRKGKPSPA